MAAATAATARCSRSANGTGSDTLTATPRHLQRHQRWPTPTAGLVEDASGNLFGTTSWRRRHGDGTVFEVRPGQRHHHRPRHLQRHQRGHPHAGLVEDASGNLFGTTNGGGTNNDGTVFEVAHGSGALTTLATFNGANGANPGPAWSRTPAATSSARPTGGGANGDGTVFEVANPAAASQISFTTPPTSVTAGQQSGPITLQVDDANGNPVPDEKIDLSSSSATGTFYDSAGATVITSVTTDANGDPVSFLYEDTAAGPVTLTATDANSSVSMTQTETVAAGAAASIAFVSPDATSVTAGQESGVITIQATDANGNLVSNETVDLSSSSATGTFYDSTGANVITSVTTDANGDPVSFLYEDTAAGAPTLTAKDHANSSVSMSQTETVDPGPVSSIEFVPPDAASVTAGQESGVITIQATDATGNPVPGAAVDLSSSSGTGTFYDSTGANLITSAYTDANGDASFLYEDTAAAHRP